VHRVEPGSATPPDGDRFLGTWTLVPELSLYESGAPPASGTYTIAEPTPGRLALHVSWREAPDGPVRETSFGGPSDGTPQPLPLPPGVAARPAGSPDALTLTRIDAATLDSAALGAAAVVAFARRVASADGLLLAVVQEAVLPDGRRVRNFQLYRRASAAPPVT
jgi:hypothetical protein